MKMRTTNIRFLLAIIAVSAMGMASNVMAAPLTTSPAWSDSGQSYHACNAVNVSLVPQTVTIDLINSSGTVVSTATPTLAVGTSAEVALGSGGDFGGFASCRFTTAKNFTIRGNMTVFRWTGTFYDSLAVIEAH
jgi:hypothetical protein